MSEESPVEVGLVPAKGLFHLKKIGWRLVVEPGELEFPESGVRIGDSFAFVSPSGERCEARIRSLGSASRGNNSPRAIEFGLEGDGLALSRVSPGWKVCLGRVVVGA